MSLSLTLEQGLESTPLGRYRLVALLGQGGMADVYLAATKGPGGFQKLLVVKLARFTGDPMFSTMFLDEARLAAQLSHPNIVQTFEVGEDGTRHYIVMEYLDGANLARLRYRARKRGGVPLRMSIHILMQVLEGLAYAHEARGIDGRPLKVVHRDLTPTNVVITAHGEVKILDFGIAKAADSQSFTAMGKYSGKLQYMPPEQLRAESIDARADIFSVGVILAEAAIQNRFWGDATMPNIAQRLGAGDLPSLADAKELDPELRRICERALTADREDRYASAAAFKSDLNVFLHTLGGSVSREELAAFVCETVKEDRARLQEVIDSQLARNSAPVINASSSTLPRFEQTPVASIYNETFKDASPNDEPEVTIEKEPEPVAAAATPKHLTIPPAVEPTALPIAPRPSGVPIKWVVVGGGAVATAAVVLFLALRSPHDAPPPPAPVPAAAIPTPAPPPVATTARVEVIVSPADATLELDGQPLGSNPYVGTFPRDANAHELVVKAAGYLPMNRRFTLEQDLSLQLQLTKAATPRPIATPATAAAVVAAPVHPRTPPAARPPGAAPPPPQPAVTAIAPVATVAPPAPPPDKRSLDPNVYAPDKKRSLDPNVYTDDTKPKPTIDRDNPWKK